MIAFATLVVIADEPLARLAVEQTDVVPYLDPRTARVPAGTDLQNRLYLAATALARPKLSLASSGRASAFDSFSCSKQLGCER